MPIDDVDDLREHLQMAIQVELTTIPPYLYAMYSILEPASTATKLLRSVAAEEMLHATLMANILLAVGGEPRFYDPAVVPRYPCALPHHMPELIVELEPCTLEVLERTFITIERPGDPGAPEEPDVWESQGQLYHALESAMRRLDAQSPLFGDPRRDRQVHDPHGYVAVKYDSLESGGLVVVDSLERAIDATEIAIHQGEGLSEDRYADPRHSELTHYAKFRRVADGDVEIGEIAPAIRTPRAAELGDDARPVAEFFNALYSWIFVVMDRLVAPDAIDRHHQVGLLYGSMVALMGPVARYLMTLPAPGGGVCGPPFELYEFAHVDDAESEIRALGHALDDDHPKLRPVLNQLDRL